MNIRQIISEHLSRVVDDLEAARAAEAQLRALDITEWPAAVKATPALQTAGALTYLLRIAQEKLDQDVNHARLLAELALEYLPEDPRYVVQRGHAMKIQAHSLRLLGESRAAYTVIQQSIAVLSALLPVSSAQLQYAKLLFALLTHERGDAYLALSCLRECVQTFEESGHAYGLLQAQMMQAAVLYELAQYDRARQLYLSSLDLAEAIGDERSSARILANLGQCAQRLGDDQEAITYFAAAVPCCENQGLDEAVQKILWGIAAIARRRGNLNLALSTLQATRDEFLRRGMLLSAAVVALDILILAVELPRNDLLQPLTRELIDVFGKSDMPMLALKEFNDLHLLATNRVLERKDITIARKRLNVMLAA